MGEKKRIFLVLPPDGRNARYKRVDFVKQCQRLGYAATTEEAFLKACDEVWYSAVYGVTSEMKMLIEAAEKEKLGIAEKWTVNATESHLDVHKFIFKDGVYPMPDCMLLHNDSGMDDETTKQVTQKYFHEFSQKIGLVGAERIKENGGIYNPLTLELAVNTFDYFERSYIEGEIPRIDKTDFRHSLDFFNSNIGNRPEPIKKPSSYKDYLTNGVCRYLASCV